MAMDKQFPERHPLVSVVMCTYNARPYIESAVNCILNQTYQNLELVISDDWSSDGTREWLKKLTDPRIRLFLQEKNLGYVANKNFGHQQARGTYITQLDNDDLCALDRLEKQVEVVVKHPEIKIVGTGYYRIDDNGQVYGTETREKDLILDQWNGKFPFWFPSLLVHREVFETIGYFDLYFSGVLGDDVYWTLKANHKYLIYYLKEPLYSYRNNPNSITNVLNNERKLIINKVKGELFRQRKETGTDWLEMKDFEALAKYENQLLQDDRFMAEQYRIWAAKAIDKKNWQQAGQLLKTSFNRNRGNKHLYQTLFYYIRKRIGLT